jgi:hypothetical protein
MARVLLYHYFVQLCESSEISHKQQAVGHDRTTAAIDELLKEMYGSDQQGCDPEVYEKRRKSFHNNKRIGKRWATLINFLGYGVLLLCSDQMNTQM